MNDYDLTISKVAKIANCHNNTVKRYADRGFLRPMRDTNGYRRFPESDARKLKELLDYRGSA